MNNNTKILMDLGLTFVQAKTYLALVTSDSLTIRELSSVSGVPRTDLYRVIKELEETGLVEKIIANPVKFKAASIEEVLNHLIHKKNRETLEITKKAIKLKKEIKTKTKKKLSHKSDKFILVPSKRTPDRIGEAIVRAKKSVNLVVSLPRFSRGLDVFSEKLRESWSKNVKWRIIIEFSPQSNNSLEHIQFCREEPFCEIRFVPSSITTITGIYDQKEAFIVENPSAGLSDSPALWTDNKSLVSLAKDYFEILWITAMKEPTYFTD